MSIWSDWMSYWNPTLSTHCALHALSTFVPYCVFCVSHIFDRYFCSILYFQLLFDVFSLFSWGFRKGWLWCFLIHFLPERRLLSWFTFTSLLISTLFCCWFLLSLLHCLFSPCFVFSCTFSFFPCSLPLEVFVFLWMITHTMLLSG